MHGMRRQPSFGVAQYDKQVNEWGKGCEASRARGGTRPDAVRAAQAQAARGGARAASGDHACRGLAA